MQTRKKKALTCSSGDWCVGTDSILPCGEEGFDIHPLGQRHAGRRPHQFREAAHDRQRGIAVTLVIHHSLISFTFALVLRLHQGS